MENLTIIMQDESDGDMDSLDGNKLENVLVALKVREGGNRHRHINSDQP